MDSLERPAYTVSEQIEKLTRSGVVFEKYSLANAIEYLTDCTYFFKIKAFDDSFVKLPNGKYANLDFALLKDIASIDHHLRTLLFNLSADIEHAVRIRFNQILMQSADDGYAFLYSSSFTDTNGHLSNPHKSAYNIAMIDKYKTKPRLWVFWETSTMSELFNCYKEFLKREGLVDSTQNLLEGVRHLRNASAHHNCLLIPRTKPTKTTKDIANYLPILMGDNLEGLAQIQKIYSKDTLINDLCCLILVHTMIVASPRTRQRAYKKVKDFRKRMNQHAKWYKEPNTTRVTLTRQLTALNIILESYEHFAEQVEEAPKQYARLLQLPDKPSRRRGRRGKRN